MGALAGLASRRSPDPPFVWGFVVSCARAVPVGGAFDGGAGASIGRLRGRPGLPRSLIEAAASGRSTTGFMRGPDVASVRPSGPWVCHAPRWPIVVSDY